jgi:hypothetical protein
MRQIDVHQLSDKANFNGFHGLVLFACALIIVCLDDHRRPVPGTPGFQLVDTVGQIKIQFPPNITFTEQFNISPVDGTLRRNEVYLKAVFGRTMAG